MVSSVRRPDRGEEGQALVVALVALLLLGAALALVAGTLVARMNRVRAEARETVLLALGDAAVAETLANLAAWPVSPGVAPRDFGGGTIESRVTRLPHDGFTAVAQAAYRGESLSVEVKGRLTELGPVVDGWRRLPPDDGDGGSFQPPR